MPKSLIRQWEELRNSYKLKRFCCFFVTCWDKLQVCFCLERQNSFLKSYTKLSCKVRTSGRLGNLSTSFKGERADLRIQGKSNYICLVQTIWLAMEKLQQGLISVVHVGKQLKFRNGTGTGIESWNCNFVSNYQEKKIEKKIKHAYRHSTFQFAIFLEEPHCSLALHKAKGLVQSLDRSSLNCLPDQIHVICISMFLLTKLSKFIILKSIIL